MNLNTFWQHLASSETVPADAHGQWYIATDVLNKTNIEDLSIQATTGAIVLAARRGFWNSNSKEEIELFLWGTAEQLDAAQEMFRLQPIVDALLDRPEIYWG